MTYRLPSLSYAYDALEPYMDARTVELQYSLHHAACVMKLNEALEGRTVLSRTPLEEIIADIRKVPEDIRQDVRNAAGGHLNHSLFWHILGPPRQSRPPGQLLEAIDAAFGSVAIFEEEFSRAAMERFGSGWAWLCVDMRGRLELVTTPNEDSPIMLGCRPVIGLDLWEHAYYLKYHNRRGDYVAAWWNVVDWDRAAEVYAHCLDWVARVR